MFNYSIILMWSDEDNCYIARIPEFPGLSAFGDTPEEAVKEAKIAAEGFLDVYKEDGCQIPEPHILEDFSGQTRLRLPKSLHANLSQQAEKEGISLNSYIVHLLSKNSVHQSLEKEIAELKDLANTSSRVLDTFISDISKSHNFFKIDMFSNMDGIEDEIHATSFRFINN